MSIYPNGMSEEQYLAAIRWSNLAGALYRMGRDGGKELVGGCEGCGVPIFHGEGGIHLIMENIHLCASCKPEVADNG